MIDPYTVIIDPNSALTEKYYVADRRHIKVDRRRGDGGVNMPNWMWIHRGGARVSQFYHFPETACSHRDDLNRIEQEKVDAKLEDKILRL